MFIIAILEILSFGRRDYFYYINCAAIAVRRIYLKIGTGCKNLTVYSDILITGGAGFMGSDFVRYLLEVEPNANITVFDSLTYAGNPDNLPAGVRLIKGDLLDQEIVDEAVADSDLVVHFAAETHNDKALENPRPFVESNIVGTFNVLEAVRKWNVRLHHVSTDEVYGGLPLDVDFSVDEGFGLNPSNPYSATKAASDLLVKAWTRTYSIKATISNSTNNFGPRQNIEKFIPRQIVRLAAGRKAILYGDGLNMRNWLYVRDHSRAVWEIIQRGVIGESYLISGHQELRNREVLDLILEIMGRTWNDVEMVDDRINHDLRYPIDSSKLRCELGWKPIFDDFKSSLISTIKWYLDNRQWWNGESDKV